MAEELDQLAVGALADVAIGDEQVLLVLEVELRVGAQELGELLEAALEARLLDDPVHLGPDAGHLGEAELVDLPRRLLGGGHLPHAVAVPGLSVRQLRHADRLAAAGDVGLLEIVEQLAVGGDHLLGERLHRRRPHALLLGGGKVLGKAGEGAQHRAGQGVFDQQVADLLRHVAQGDAGRGDAHPQALGEPGDGLLDQGGHRPQAAQDVLVILNAPRRHDRQHAGDILLHPGDLGDRQQFAREPLALDLLLEVAQDEVVVEPVLALEWRAVERPEDLERLGHVGIAALERRQRAVGPAAVIARIADRGGELRMLVHRVLEVEVDELLQPLALGLSLGVHAQRLAALQDRLASGFVVAGDGRPGREEKSSGCGEYLVHEFPPCGGGEQAAYRWGAGEPPAHPNRTTDVPASGFGG